MEMISYSVANRLPITSGTTNKSVLTGAHRVNSYHRLFPDFQSYILEKTTHPVIQKHFPYIKLSILFLRNGV